MAYRAGAVWTPVRSDHRRRVCVEVGSVVAVGYGLDHGGKYRNLPEIVELKLPD